MQHQQHLTRTTASVGVARHHLRAALADAGVGDPVAYDAQLVLTELVSNAVEHGHPDASGEIEVGWTIDPDRIVIDVRDAGPAPRIHPGRPTPDSTRGRGLLIVEDICSSWHVETDHGTRIVAELALQAA
ncbi:ATP-binding protein [Nocardioides bruguierae]|uniref:ATP-binding protein n=1 Tax=Nocardioides bruguierae TaxID=2945102 RepID=A0A9X2DB24_9ACTN|nr:ATP-binding protein [Nocardioides bruguierae]MCL8027171.1 ATP-binding protein [Nocardioides bruguierae]MCM0622324.1 ATP-binding protein [Nocardioides bruguierae]